MLELLLATEILRNDVFGFLNKLCHIFFCVLKRIAVRCSVADFDVCINSLLVELIQDAVLLEFYKEIR